MSYAAAALLCCCGDRPLCGSCPASYAISWTGSVELLALCCSQVFCLNPDVSNGEFSTDCDPCTMSIVPGGGYCNGDCPGHGCFIVVYNASAGPFTITVNAVPQTGSPCVYLGSINEEIGEIKWCCPPDPDRKYCGSGKWGTIRMVATATMQRGLGGGDQDWDISISIQIVFLSVSGLVSDSLSYNVLFTASGSGSQCPHTVAFHQVAADGFGFASGRIPCNVSSSIPFPTINVHADDPGTVTVEMA